MLTVEEEKIFSHPRDDEVLVYSLMGGPSRFDLMLYFWDTTKRPDPFFKVGMRTAQLTIKLSKSKSDDSVTFHFEGTLLGAHGMHIKAADLLIGKRVLVQYDVDKRYGFVAFPDVSKAEVDALVQPK